MTAEENKAWVKEFWETHDVITTPTFEFISWVREKQKWLDDRELFEEREKAFEAGYETATRYACEWLKERNVLTEASLEGFRKSMKEE